MDKAGRFQWSVSGQGRLVSVVGWWPRQVGFSCRLVSKAG